MKKLVVFYFVLFVLLSACGIHMQQTVLVDEWGSTYDSKSSREFQDREVYSDQSVDVWGLEKTDCKNFARIDSISYSGKSSLSISWDKTGKCPWIGFGIGWNGYAPKDLSDVMATGSIDFYMRAIEGKQFIPTLIFLLEDYAGVQTATVLKAKQLQRYPIDTQWQKVSIPLSAFLQAAAPLSDFSNIKSLNIECQGSGAFLFDELKIGGAEIKPGSSQKFGQVTATNYPIVLFHDELTYAWGLGNYPGRNITLTSDEYYSGNKGLNLKWNEQEMGKGNRQMGLNWDHWQAIAIKDSMSQLSLHFFVKGNYPAALGQLQVGFESYNGKSNLVNVASNYTKPSKLKENWMEVTIPFADFNFDKNGFDINRFKQFLIQMNGIGDVWIDEISIQKN